MNFLFTLAGKVDPVWPLRLGLGLMYIYSGYDLFYHPASWTWAVRALPDWIQNTMTALMSVETFLRFQGAAEFLVALLFLAWFSGVWGLRIAAIFATIEMAAILLFVGIDPITFRDIGLLGGSAALLLLSFRTKDRGESKPF